MEVKQINSLNIFLYPDGDIELESYNDTTLLRPKEIEELINVLVKHVNEHHKS